MLFQFIKDTILSIVTKTEVTNTNEVTKKTTDNENNEDSVLILLQM